MLVLLLNEYECGIRYYCWSINLYVACDGA